MHDADIDLLILWAAHTHLCEQTYTTPRLVLDSPVPGSGKTTALEHLQRLCLRPIQAASLSSPAMLSRLLDKELRTVLIDEVDRNLNPKKDGVEDLLAIINAGYKRGATRPVLVPTRDGWDVKEMPTYSPIAMAGNSPTLPDDTRSRTIRVLLLPDLEGRVETSDWEEIEPDAIDLGEALAIWAEQVRDVVRTVRPELPAGCIGRTKERWNPLRRVAEAAGGRWPSVCEELIHRDLAEAVADRADGMERIPPAVTLLRDLAAYWPEDRPFWATEQILSTLVLSNAEIWGRESAYGKALTAQRMGRMLVTSFKVNSDRPGGVGPRGYQVRDLTPVWRRMGVPLPTRTGGAGGAGGTGGDS
ncbi:hypothetical protein DBB34_06570 [Sphaerisporangium cinnabarinum]|nr:DUF3631 domain-containing protein [Sphaerisporangium cinnabarinum]PTU57012.1 hypothetical protein DBB34_06570 [Sphaerisporangium cinnabarinum]